MRYPSRFVVWSALLTCCVLFWVWLVGLIVDLLPVDDEPRAELLGPAGRVRAEVIFPQEWAGTVLDISVGPR
jgi:hypothetical protein